MLELFPVCFSCNNTFNPSQSLSGSGHKNIVFETPEAETINHGELNNVISDLS